VFSSFAALTSGYLDVKINQCSIAYLDVEIVEVKI